MSFKINLAPFSAAPYFTVREHILKYDGLNNIHSDLKSAEKQLREFLLLSPAYNFNVIPKSEKDVLLQGFGPALLLDDPFTGRNELNSNPVSQADDDVVDISFSFPHCTLQNHSTFKVIICDTNASLGIPGEFLLVFHKVNSMGQYAFDKQQNSSGFTRYIYLLSSVLADLQEKQIEVLLRETNYKAAVLYQLIDGNKNLNSNVQKDCRSKSVIAAECTLEFADRIEKLGYQIFRQEKEGKLIIVVANYVTQSKELIEMFADRVDAL